VTGTAPERRSLFLRPIVALPLIFAAIVIVAVLTPERDSGLGDPRLTSESAGPLGARAMYELAQRLGWRATKRIAEPTGAFDPRAIEYLLAPPLPPAATETHALLEHVRQGSALLYVLGPPGPLDDSLAVREGFGGHFTLGGAVDRAAADSADTAQEGCGAHVRRSVFDPLSYVILDTAAVVSLAWRRPPAPVIDTFAKAWLRPPNGRPRHFAGVAMGFRYGRGRIVVASDPIMMRNDALRVCTLGIDVAAVRMLEFLSATDDGAPSRNHVVFDEFHQGFGPQPGAMRAIWFYLRSTPSGHALAQILGAALVLLLATGPRAIPPRDPEHIERRSPLEHVEALARAYSQVGATRTATVRLVNGIRRRTMKTVSGVAGAHTNDAFFDWALSRAPTMRPDVDVIRHALDVRVSRRDFVAVGGALQRLESALMKGLR
jgi:hypothetical protein